MSGEAFTSGDDEPMALRELSQFASDVVSSLPVLVHIRRSAAGRAARADGDGRLYYQCAHIGTKAAPPAFHRGQRSLVYCAVRSGRAATAQRRVARTREHLGPQALEE
jgi:hypothetical protein